jgi:NAD(P)-dependent dehydrogenase (short-subunit alcohol dehydrogenase family)
MDRQTCTDYWSLIRNRQSIWRNTLPGRTATWFSPRARSSGCGRPQTRLSLRFEPRPAKISADQIRIELIAADLAHPESPQSIFDQTTAAGLTIDLLINNAGFGMADPFAEQTLDRQLEMIQVNVILTRRPDKTLPAGNDGTSRRSDRSGGLDRRLPGVPWLSLYAGTKALVMNFSEGLR